MEHSYSHKYNRIKIRPLEVHQIENLRILRNTHRHCFIYSDTITKEAQQKWYENYLLKPNDYTFSIFYENKWIGAASIYNITGSSAEFGRLLIDRTATNERGLGLDATIGVCSIAFEQLNINKIHLQVYKDNISAYKTYIKAGFKVSGTSEDSSGKILVDMELCKNI